MTGLPTAPTEMTALRVHPPGGAGRLSIDRLPVPALRDGEVLVRVAAAAITRGELEWAEDRLPAIPCYELAGTVVDTGSAMEFSLGDEVFGMTAFDSDGVAAEYVAVPVSHLAPRPRLLSWGGSASVPLPGLTALQGLFTHGHLTAGQTVLIHGGAGVVGALAVQLARRQGARVLVTASGSGLDVARELGADRVIDPSTEDLTAIPPVDLVLDTAGGDRLKRSPAVIRRGGRLVSISEQPPVDACTGGGIEGVYFVVEPDAAALRELSSLVDSGELRIPPVAGYPPTRAREAFEHVEDRARPGKVVLEMANDFHTFVEQRHEAAAAYVNGDPEPLGELVARQLPASFFSPRGDATVGTEEVAGRYRRDDAMFRPGSSNTMQTVDAAAADGIGYWVGIQRSQARVRGEDEPVPFALRITEVYRREDGRWRLVHRHASPLQEGEQPEA